MFPLLLEIFCSAKECLSICQQTLIEYHHIWSCLFLSSFPSFFGFFYSSNIAKIQGEAEDLDQREMELMAKETQQVQHELEHAKSQIETVIQKFEKQLRISGRDQLNYLIRESESAIASIVKAHTPADSFPINEADRALYTPQIGEQVHVKGLGGKLATVVESPGDDGTIMVQYGKVKVRVKKSNIIAIPSSRKNAVTSSSSTHQGRQVRIKMFRYLLSCKCSIDIITLKEENKVIYFSI